MCLLLEEIHRGMSRMRRSSSFPLICVFEDAAASSEKLTSTEETVSDEIILIYSTNLPWGQNRLIRILLYQSVLLKFVFKL